MILCEKIKKPDCFRKTSSIFIGNILNFDISDARTEYFILKYTLGRSVHFSVHNFCLYISHQAILCGTCTILNSIQ